MAICIVGALITAWLTKETMNTSLEEVDAGSGVEAAHIAGQRAQRLRDMRDRAGSDTKGEVGGGGEEGGDDSMDADAAATLRGDFAAGAANGDVAGKSERLPILQEMRAAEGGMGTDSDSARISPLVSALAAARVADALPQVHQDATPA